MSSGIAVLPRVVSSISDLGIVTSFPSAVIEPDLLVVLRLDDARDDLAVGPGDQGGLEPLGDLLVWQDDGF